MAGLPVYQEEEFDIPVTKPAGQIKVRVYRPEGPGPFPVHLNYHGGKNQPFRKPLYLLMLEQEGGFWGV